MTKVARCIGSGATLIVVGLVLTVGWFLAHHNVTHSITTGQIRDALVIESVNSKGYYDWEEGNALNNYNYYVYYAFNITNPDDVLNNSKPIYEQLGPYYYKYIWYNKNATFLDNGNIVQYNMIEDYIFAPELSVGDPTKDMITMFNPAYITILATTNGDQFLLLVGMLPFIQSFIDFCSGEFLEVISSQYTPSALNDTVNSMYSFITPDFKNNQTKAVEYFYENWANGNATPIEFINWPYLFPTIAPSDAIPASTVASLFSETSSYSLLDSGIPAIMAWFRASNNEEGVEAQMLQKTFSLSSSQLHSVLVWRNATFIPAYVRPLVMAQGQKYYPISTWEELGWVQYVHMGFTAPNSIVDVYGSYYPQFPIEFELDPNSFGIGQAQMMLVGPVGLLNNIANFGPFGDVILSGADSSPWGISSTQATDFFSYMSTLTANYSLPYITDLIDSGKSGLIMTESLDYWMWRCMDPIVEFLVGAGQAYCGLQVNNTVQPPSQTYTGKDDLSKLGSYVMWRNQTTVYYWNEPVNVSGNTDAGQFGPAVKDGQALFVWDESFVKPIEFNPIGNAQVLGIDVIKYVLNASTFGVSTLYGNLIEGFANESATNQGAPIFLSNFDFYGVNPKYGNFSGVNTSSTDVVTIYVEPNTGATLQADETLQINLYYPPGAAGSSGWNKQFFQYANVKDDEMYPLLKAYQKSQVGEAQAKKLKGQLVFFKKPFNEGILWGMFSLGALLLIIGVLLVIKGFRLRHRHEHLGYQDIN